MILVPTSSAAAADVLADWRMNEGRDATVMHDSSGRGINGEIGSEVRTGYRVANATAYRWPYTTNDPPAQPERLVTVDDDRLNPGSRDYTITVRFRTTRSSGNVIQKGQSRTPGGYFKWEIPRGRLTCLFRSRDSNGNLINERAVRSPSGVALNDGEWHTVRCEKTSDALTLTVDREMTVTSQRGPIGPIANTYPLTIGGKLNCDQRDVTCDYFVGDIDFVRILTG